MNIRRGSSLVFSQSWVYSYPAFSLQLFTHSASSSSAKRNLSLVPHPRYPKSLLFFVFSDRFANTEICKSVFHCCHRIFLSPFHFSFRRLSFPSVLSSSLVSSLTYFSLALSLSLSLSGLEENLEGAARLLTHSSSPGRREKFRVRSLARPLAPYVPRPRGQRK